MPYQMSLGASLHRVRCRIPFEVLESLTFAFHLAFQSSACCLCCHGNCVLRPVGNAQSKKWAITAPRYRQLAVRPYKRCLPPSHGKSSPPRYQGDKLGSKDQEPTLHVTGEGMEFRPNMDFKKGVRIRLSFDEAGMLTPLQVEQGLSKCWILVHHHILSIGHLAAHIAVKFDLQHSCRDGISLEMGGYALPPTELPSLLQDSDLISVKRQKRVESTSLPPGALQSREGVPNKLKVVNRKDVNGTLRTHVQGPSGPLPTIDVTPYHLNRGPIPVRQPSSSTPQGSQAPQAGTTSQPPQAPCPDTPTQSGGVEVRGPENGTQAPQSEEEKEEGTESSVLTVPEVIVLDDNGQDVLETDAADGTVEKSVVTEKPNPEENQSTVTDEPDAEKTDIVLAATPLSEKRKFATVYEPGAKQYKRMRVTGPHAMKTAAAVRAALIGAARPKPPSRYRLHPEPRERSASNYSEMWARKSFDAWRAQNGVPTELSIEDLSEQEDVTPFVDQLCEFMSQLTKQNGQLYPPTSIQAMLRAIGRIIRARETKRTAETGIAKVPFNISLDPRYLKVKVAVEEAVLKSAAMESAQEVMALEARPLMDEAEMLRQCKFSKTHPEGCSRRFAYFCLRDFCVKGRSELRELSDVDFELYTDEHGDCLRYTQHMGVNWKLNIDDKPRHSIRCYNPDVLETYQILMAHRPLWLDTEPPPHALFLTSLPKWSDRDVWYAKVPVGKNKFSIWNQDVIASLGGLPGKGAAKFDYSVDTTRLDFS